MKVTIFKPRVQFQPIDPLGDGLGDAIEEERRESQAIHLDDAEDSLRIQQFWQEVEQDIHVSGALSFSDD